MQIFYPESLFDKCRLAVFPNDFLERLNIRENLSPPLPSLASWMILCGLNDVMANGGSRVGLPIE